MLTISVIRPIGLFEKAFCKAAEKSTHNTISEFAHWFVDEIKKIKREHIVPPEDNYDVLLLSDGAKEWIEVWHRNKYMVRTRQIMTASVNHSL